MMMMMDSTPDGPMGLHAAMNTHRTTSIIARSSTAPASMQLKTASSSSHPWVETEDVCIHIPSNKYSLHWCMMNDNDRVREAAQLVMLHIWPN